LKWRLIMLMLSLCILHLRDAIVYCNRSGDVTWRHAMTSSHGLDGVRRGFGRVPTTKKSPMTSLLPKFSERFPNITEGKTGQRRT
jgi:hypothetical protein